MGARLYFERPLIPASRRVDEVRLIIGDGPLRAEVHGIGHRFPAPVPVSVHLAAPLVENAAPLTIVDDRSADPCVEVSVLW